MNTNQKFTLSKLVLIALFVIVVSAYWTTAFVKGDSIPRSASPDYYSDYGSSSSTYSVRDEDGESDDDFKFDESDDTESGDADDLFESACEKSYGVNNASINAKEGFRLFELAMKAGSMEAQAEVADIYFSGLGAPCDRNKAFQLAQKPADKGNPLAASVLGRCYADGLGGARKDDDKSQKYFRQAFEGFKRKAESGDKAAQNSLGLCYKKGQGVTKDGQLAFDWFSKSAEQEYAPAQYNVSVCYLEGEGVERDLRKAVQLFGDSAKKGYAPAQYMLSLFDMIFKHEDMGISWVRAAAEQGYPAAQSSLGTDYALGRGVEQDSKTAVEWYRKAAENGDADGQFFLGNCYSMGDGIEKNSKVAAEWFLKAAEQGHAGAQFNLGACYANGEGVERDFKTAIEWLRKSAEQENIEALNALAIFYRKGIGVSKDLTKATEFEKRAEEAKASSKVLDKALDSLK